MPKPVRTIIRRVVAPSAGAASAGAASAPTAALFTIRENNLPIRRKTKTKRRVTRRHKNIPDPIHVLKESCTSTSRSAVTRRRKEIAMKLGLC